MRELDSQINLKVTAWEVRGNSVKILIADDSIVSRHLLEATLRKWGYDVMVACDGAEALELLQREDAPALIILDWMMPGMTGVEVCRRIRQRDSEPYTYILLLTSKSQKEDLIEGMDAGADDYITKPFDQNELQVRPAGRYPAGGSAVAAAESAGRSARAGHPGFAHALVEPQFHPG